MKRVFLVLAALSILCTPAVLGRRDTSEKAEPSEELKLSPNVIVTITIGDVEKPDADRRSYRLIARDGERSEILMGWRTPLPTSRATEGDDGAPVTSYTYQNVGVTSKIEVQLLPDRQVLLNGQIEVSGAREDPGEGADGSRPPTIGTFQQSLVALLRENEPLRVAQVPDPDGGSLYIELEVDILD